MRLDLSGGVTDDVVPFAGDQKRSLGRIADRIPPGRLIMLEGDGRLATASRVDAAVCNAALVSSNDHMP